MPRVQPKHVRQARRDAMDRGAAPPFPLAVLEEDPDELMRRAYEASAAAPPLSVEPYGPHSSRSWFADLAWATLQPQARRELPPPPPFIGSAEQAELRLRAASISEYRSSLGPPEERSLSTTATAGGNFVPPAYLGEAFAEGVRSTGVLTEILPTEPIPDTGMVLTTPRITTGATAAVQAAEHDALEETSIVEALVSSPVATIETMQDLSTQLFDRSEAGAVAGAELWLARELGKAIGSLRDQQLLDGTAANGQTRGLTQVASIGTVAYTDASPTQAEGFPKILQAASELASNGGWPEATAILMHPRRAAWFAGWKDTGGTPAVIPWPAPVFTVPAIPTTGGAGTNEDYVLVLRREELPAYVGPIRLRAYPQVLSGVLTVRVVAFQYLSTLFGRMPLAICKVSGAGFAGVTFA